MAVLCALLAPGCDHPAGEEPSPARTAQDLPRLAVVQVSRQRWPAVVRVQGSLYVDEEAVLGAKVAGRVETVLVDLGSVVRRGEILAALEPRDFDLKIQEAENQRAQVRAKLGLAPGDPDHKLDPLKAPPVVQEKALLAEAQFNYDRAISLRRQGATAKEDVDKCEAALGVAKARLDAAINGVKEQIALLALRQTELELAQQQKADSVVRAPFDGVIRERQAAPGGYLHVGDPVLTLVRVDPLRFRCGIPEVYAEQVELGGAVWIHVEKQQQPISAKISRIDPALEMATRSLGIEADIPNPRGEWHAGTFVQADIVLQEDAQTLAVPEQAVVEFAGVEKVWTVRGQEAREQRVQTGRRDRGLVEILGGLQAGDLVVADGPQGRSGPIIIAETAPPAAGGGQ
jgi:RND family efflux transporter MFP subunit